MKIHNLAGVVLLITHVERKPLHPMFRSLMTKQFQRETDERIVLAVAETKLTVHENFRLYLSTSLPMLLKGILLNHVRR